MKSVTLEELVEWVKANTKRTWEFKNFGQKGSTLEIKYLDFSVYTSYET